MAIENNWARIAFEEDHFRAVKKDSERQRELVNKFAENTLWQRPRVSLPPTNANNFPPQKP